MKLSFSHIISFLYLALMTNIALGQYQIEIKLTIDTDCFCNDSSTLKLNGKFGIYAYTPIPKYSGNYTDTLIRELEQKKEQIITLDQGNYKFIYTPNDSLERVNQYYFNLNPYETQIHLNCFFFNKRYSPLLDQMSKKDTIVISSTYFGNTNGETLIPSHTVVIFRERKKYFASYYKTEHRETFLYLQSPKYESQILLSEEQVQQFREFEEKNLNLSINDNLNYEATAKNSIRLNGKNISFYSKGYVSLLLWNELNKTTINDLTQEVDTLKVFQNDTSVFNIETSMVQWPCRKPEWQTTYEMIAPQDSTYYIIYNDKGQIDEEGLYTSQYVIKDSLYSGFFNTKYYYYKDNGRLSGICYQVDGRIVKKEYYKRGKLKETKILAN